MTAAERYVSAVVGAKANREAAELRLNEVVLNAVEAGVSYRTLGAATGLAHGWLHKRAQRAKALRPHA